MKSTCWDTRATDSIIKSGQKDTEATIYYADKKKLDWMLFAADTEKAFDSVDHNFIFATLTKFDFCDDFVKWVTVPLKGAKSCLVNIVV